MGRLPRNGPLQDLDRFIAQYKDKKRRRAAQTGKKTIIPGSLKITLSKAMFGNKLERFLQHVLFADPDLVDASRTAINKGGDAFTLRFMLKKRDVKWNTSTRRLTLQSAYVYRQGSHSSRVQQHPPMGNFDTASPTGAGYNEKVKRVKDS